VNDKIVNNVLYYYKVYLTKYEIVIFLWFWRKQYFYFQSSLKFQKHLPNKFSFQVSVSAYRWNVQNFIAKYFEKHKLLVWKALWMCFPIQLFLLYKKY